MDWEHYRFEPIEVIFAPRKEYAGRPMRPELEQHRGEKVKVFALWPMDESDPYPGEWAISCKHPESGHDIFGRLWIASGDVAIP